MSLSRRNPPVRPGLSLTRGERIALRPLAERDTAGAVRYEIIRKDDGTVIGEIETRPHEPSAGWLTVRCIEVGEGWRGWGYGSEAVRLLEARSSAERFLAEVDAGNGLGLYFWLRLGYRPARPDEAPWAGGAQSGMMPMMRTPGG